MSAQDIGDWTDAKSFHPSMSLHVVGGTADVLRVLADNLREAHWKIDDAGVDGFHARHTNVLSALQLERARTVLVVTAAAGAGTTEVTISVKSGGSHRQARRRGEVALNAAVAQLRRDGRNVTVTPWVRPA